MEDSELKKGIKPFNVNTKMIRQWQELVDSIATLLNIPSALIMRLNGTKIEVFRTSDSENNPYKLKDNEHFFDSGLYCETVIRTDDRLYVENALEDEEWKDNPDVALNMISYLGFPIKNSDNTPFGTLCILDNHSRQWSQDQENVMINFRDMIESHLELISKTKDLERLNRSLENHLELLHKTNELSQMNKTLEEMVNQDNLTNIYNRKYFFELVEALIPVAKKEKSTNNIIMVDIDNFKKLNDIYGHNFGDKVLQDLCSKTNDCLRENDIFARFGGEEFIVYLPNTDKSTTFDTAEKIRKLLETSSVEGIRYTVSIGVSEINQKDYSLEDAIKDAEVALNISKNTGKNKVSKS